MCGAIFLLMIPVAWVFLSVIFNTCIDTYNFVVKSELIDGYSEWDKLWIMPRHMPKCIPAYKDPITNRFCESKSIIEIGNEELAKIQELPDVTEEQ